MISHWILLRMRNVSDRSCRGTHILYSIHFFWKLYHLCDNMEKYGRAGQSIDDKIVRCMHIACWITKATHTHSDYVILIVFPWRQILQEHSTMLCLYVRCLSCWNCFHCVGIDTAWWAGILTLQWSCIIIEKWLISHLNLILIVTNCRAL